jgi:hypothetical protein
MEASAAIEACRLGYHEGAILWCLPLVRSLAQLPSDEPLFGWLERCVRRLLMLDGPIEPESERELARFREIVEEWPGAEPIEAHFWDLWRRRGRGGPAMVAIAQLYGAILNFRGLGGRDPVVCTAPIMLIWWDAPDRDRLFQEVIHEFEALASELRLT